MSVRGNSSADALKRATDPLINSFWSAMWWGKISVDRNDYSTFLCVKHSVVGGYACQTNSDGTTISIYTSGSNVNGSAIVVGAWNHYCLVNDSTGVGGFRLYLNGVLDATTGGVAGGTVTGVNIFCRDAVGTDWLDGCVAAVKLFNVPLALAQIRKEMKQYVPVWRRDLNSFFPCINGPFIYDYTGQGRNLVASGTLDTEGGPPIPWEVLPSIPPRRKTYIYAEAAGITFDAASNSGYNTADANYLWSHTCTGADRHLVVGISMLSVAASSVTTITYAGAPMTFLGAVSSAAGAIRVELWGLIAPATGANNIEVTLSAALDSIGGAVSHTGVNQVMPTEALNTATATNIGAADATVNVTSVADNDVVIDVVATSDTAITVGAGQTSRNNVTGTLGSGAMSTEGPKTPAGSVTMNWADVGAAATWSIASIALRPVAASSNLPAGAKLSFIMAAA